MKKIAVFLVILIAAVSICAVSATDSNQIVDGLNSTSNITNALDECKLQNKTLCMYFEQDSCHYCDLFKSDVLSNQDVQKELNDKFIFANIDINEYPQIAGELRVVGTPTVVFLDSNNTEIERIDGYVSSEDFMNVIKEI